MKRRKIEGGRKREVDTEVCWLYGKCNRSISRRKLNISIHFESNAS